MSDLLDFYKSLTPPDRLDTERSMLACAVENGVVPTSMRYYAFGDKACRGAIRGADGGLYYFQMPPNNVFHIVKAVSDENVAEVERLLTKCTLGCDLIKSEDDDAPGTAVVEDEEKGAAGSMAASPPPSVPEQQNVGAASSQVTTFHPGGAMGTTPESDGSAERWHGEDVARAMPQQSTWDYDSLRKSLSNVSQRLEATSPRAHIEPMMRRYMIEVLGKSPDEIDGGRVVLGGAQRAQFNQWATKSLRSKLGGLRGFLSKSRTG